MKKYVRINFIIALIFATPRILTAQNFSCNVSYPPGSVTSLRTSITADVSVEKVIRVIAHFPLKTDGTGNFTSKSDGRAYLSNIAFNQQRNNLTRKCFKLRYV